jgi:hypothetical protein
LTAFRLYQPLIRLRTALKDEVLKPSPGFGGKLIELKRTCRQICDEQQLRRAMKTEVRSPKSEVRKPVAPCARRITPGWTSFVSLLWLIAATTGIGQDYTIDWFTIDGGGGTSTGGVYSVSGTIGQPDAGTMSGGNYTLNGGFWGIIAAVQTPGAPLLTIFRTATNTVVVSWPSASGSFSLQLNSDLKTTNWTGAGVPLDDGTNKYIIVSPPVGNRFYRLVN